MLAKKLVQSDSCWVNKLILLFFIATHVFGFAGRASAFSTKFVAKFEVTHSHHHEHSDEHQHEEVELESKDVHTHSPTEKHTHRHEILVSTQIPYIPSSGCPCLFGIEAFVQYPKCAQEPPQGPFLHGILRPPIQA